MKKRKINLMSKAIASLRKFVKRRESESEYCVRVAGEDVGYYAGLLQGEGRERLEYLTEVLVHEFVCNAAEDKKEAEMFRMGARSVLEFLEECGRTVEVRKTQAEEGGRMRKIVPFF